ncbi:hypothetical protein [Kocuria sp. U4B]
MGINMGMLCFGVVSLLGSIALPTMSTWRRRRKRRKGKAVSLDADHAIAVGSLVLAVAGILAICGSGFL